MPVLFSVDEVAELLGFHPKHVYRICSRGELPFLRVGKRTIRVSAEAVKTYMRRSENRRPRAIINRIKKKESIRR